MEDHGEVDDLQFIIEGRDLFFGLQKWDLKSLDLEATTPGKTLEHLTDTPKGEETHYIHPHIMINKLDLRSFSIYIQMITEIHPIISSDEKTKFFEFYLWNKRKAVEEAIKSSDEKENNKELVREYKLYISERQKVNMNIDTVKM